jgi:hypothetical protein
MSHRKSQAKKRVRVAADAKESLKKRVDAGAVIAANAPSSALLTGNNEVQVAANNLIAVNTKLDAKDTKVKALELELGTERSALANLTVDWDAAYDVFVAVGRKFCLTAEDARSLGLAAVGLAAHVLAMPLAVLVKYDVVKELIRIHVKRAPGLRSLRIQISPDPITATSWVDLEGDGAMAALADYAPGTWWVRAAHIRARERSDFTMPVSVIVKK